MLWVQGAGSLPGGQRAESSGRRRHSVPGFYHSPFKFLGDIMPEESDLNHGKMSAEQEKAGHRSDLITALKEKRNFEHMPDNMLRKLLQVMEVAHYARGALVLEQGKHHQHACILLKGHVSINIDGKYIVSLRRTGEIIGEMSFVNEGPCSATVKAETDCNMIKITKATLTEIGDADFYLWLCRVLAEKLKRTSQLVSR